MRDAGEIIEEIVAVCHAYEHRARPPLMGVAQCFEDVIAHRLLMEILAPLVQEWGMCGIVPAVEAISNARAEGPR